MDDRNRTKRNAKAAAFALCAGAAGALLLPKFANATCTPPNSAPPICLSGTITAKDHDSALVEATGVPGSEWLRAGDATLGWTVVQIGPGFILIERNGQTVRIEPGEQAGIVDLADKPSDRPAPLPVAAGHGIATGLATVKQGPLRRAADAVRHGRAKAPEDGG